MSAGLPFGKGIVGVKEVKGIIDAFERIAISNGKYSGASANQARLFRALKEFFKYIRGDPRIFKFYEIHKPNLRLYSLDWLYSSGIDHQRELSAEFANFLMINFNGVDTQDFIDL